MSQEAANSPLDRRQYADELTLSEKALADQFVGEYLKDFDPFQATLRCGFMHTFAVHWAPALMRWPYVQNEIARLTRTTQIDNADEIVADKALIVNTLRQASQNGPYASRVTAASKLAEIRGLSKPDASAEAELALIDVLKEFASKAPV